MSDMQEEIKEILDNFEKYEARYKLHNETQFIITHREIQILLDYITNLQEEKNDLLDMCSRKIDEVSNLQEKNIKLKELCDKYEEEHKTTFEYWKHLIKEDYKTRIDKAIEYINNNSLYEEEYDYDYEENIHLSGINDTKARNDLLNILKGSDKE